MSWSYHSPAEKSLVIRVAGSQNHRLESSWFDPRSDHRAGPRLPACPLPPGLPPGRPPGALPSMYWLIRGDKLKGVTGLPAFPPSRGGRGCLSRGTETSISNFAVATKSSEQEKQRRDRGTEKQRVAREDSETRCGWQAGERCAARSENAKIFCMIRRRYASLAHCHSFHFCKNSGRIAKQTDHFQ